MARKPAKKRVPRKVSKTLKFTANERQRMAFQKVQDLIERNFSPEPLPDLFEEPISPKGKAYQWGSLHPDSATELNEYKRAGWKPVPASRHPLFPSENGKIVFGGSILLEISRKKYEAFVSSGISRAQKQMGEQRATLGMDPDKPQSAIGRIMPESWVVSDPYQPEHDEPYIDIPLTITIRVANRWQNAAGACKLSTEEYMRRRFNMYSHGAINGLILPIASYSDGDYTKPIPFELVENANLIVRREK